MRAWVCVPRFLFTAYLPAELDVLTPSTSTHAESPALSGPLVGARSRRLIVNADGFGFGAGATNGILEVIAAGGAVTSVSVNANFPDAERTAELVRLSPRISIGVHLNPVVGPPCLPPQEVPSLVSKNGQFHGQAFLRFLNSGRIAEDELEAEFDAQIERIRHLAGENLTHLDSHQHSHLHYLPLLIRLSRKWRIPCARTNASLICLEAPRPAAARTLAYSRRPHLLAGHLYRRWQMQTLRRAGIACADRIVSVGHAGMGRKTVKENWERVFKNLPLGTYEMICHPAHPDATLRSYARYVDERQSEMMILRRPELRAAAAAAGVALISFFDLMESN
jgi:chitin disaccharide deacetylase